jgi:hypothetical protein
MLYLLKFLDQFLLCPVKYSALFAVDANRILHRQNSALEFEQNFENCFLNTVSCSKVRLLPYLHAVQLRHCSFEIWLEINEPAGVTVLARAYGGTV